MTRRTFSLALLVALATASLGAPARAWVPEKTPRRALESSVRLALSERPARGTLAGIVVLRGGRELLSLRGGVPMQPASLTKLATTTAALDRWGPGHRFATRVLAPARSAVVSRLWLVGGGDPTFATAAFARENYLPQANDPVPVPVYPSGYPTVEALAARVRASGVRTVAGDLVVDESLFDAQRTAPGWLPRYLEHEFDVAYLSALTIDEGLADPKRAKLLSNPPAAAGAALRRALASRGVRVAGRVVGGRAPSSAVEVGRVLSPPLAEIVAYVNRWSINYPAELLLKGLGADFGGGGTTAEGVKVVRVTLGRLGIPLDGAVLADGSGLSVRNRLMPRTIAAILAHMLHRDDAAGEAMRASLPVAGGPGTLFRRMTRWPTRGNLRGKTGFIQRVRAMAGWVTAADGVPLVYVAVFNRAPSPLSLTRPLDDLGTSLARFPRR